jgi:hypothetical protein
LMPLVYHMIIEMSIGLCKIEPFYFLRIFKPLTSAQSGGKYPPPG